MINVMHLNHPETIPSSQPPPPLFWKNCLPQNWSLMPKRLGTADIHDIFINSSMLYITSLFLQVGSLGIEWLVFCFSSVAQSCPTLLQPHGLQHARLPSPSPTPGACSNSCPLSRWCHLTISSSIIPFSFCTQSFQASGSFPMSQFFVSGGHNIAASASASVLPMNIKDWFSWVLTNLISLQSKGLSRVCSNTTVLKHQFFQWIFKIDFL